MSYELARVDEVNVDGLKQIGAILAESGYFNSENQRASAAQLMVKVLAGRELGYGPWASAAGIHIIKGKMTVSANLMADAVKRSGRYDYRITKMDGDGVSIDFYAIDAGKRELLGTSTFTKEDAAAAGTQNMKAYARNMMFARAMSNGVKWFAPDCFNGNAVYVPEEMGANVNGEGEVIDSKPQPTNGNGNHKEVAQPVTVDVAQSGQPEQVDGDKVKKTGFERALAAFNIRGAELFGQKEWDGDNGARHLLVKSYTLKHGPVRESSKELSEQELDALRYELQNYPDDYKAMWMRRKAKILAERQAVDVEQAIAASAPMSDGNPFEVEPATVPA